MLRILDKALTRSETMNGATAEGIIAQYASFQVSLPVQSFIHVCPMLSDTFNKHAHTYRANK